MAFITVSIVQVKSKNLELLYELKCFKFGSWKYSLGTRSWDFSQCESNLYPISFNFGIVFVELWTSSLSWWNWILHQNGSVLAWLCISIDKKRRITISYHCFSFLRAIDEYYTKRIPKNTGKNLSNRHFCLSELCPQTRHPVPTIMLTISWTLFKPYWSHATYIELNFTWMM